MAVTLPVAGRRLPVAGAKEDVWINTACDMCYNACSIRVHRVDGVAVKIEGIPEAGPNYGLTCAKGTAGLMNVYSPGRVQAPMVRTNPQKGVDVDPGWREVSWEEALDLLTSKVRAAMAKDPRSIIGLTFDRYTYAMLRAFASAVGSPNVTMGSAGFFCGNGTHPVAFSLTGSNEIHADLKYCDHVLMFGASAGFVAGHNAMGLSREMADARARGMKLTVVDPVCSYAASQADEWVPIRPGTDAAFALAMAREWVLELDRYDKTFLRRHTNATYLIGEDGRYVRDAATGKPLVGIAATGETLPYDVAPSDEAALEGSFTVAGCAARPSFAAYKAHLAPYTPEYASQITSVPAATIRRIAHELVDAAQIGQTINLEGDTYPLRPAAVTWYRGISAHKHAMLTGMSLGQLDILLGAVDVPGGVLNSSSMGPDWAPKLDPDGLMTPGNPGAGHMKPALPRRTVKQPQTMELIELFPVSVYARAMLWLGVLHGEEYGLDYKPEVLIQARANIVETGGDPVVLAEALRSIPFICSMSVFPDETTRFADLLLPDQHSLERLVPIVSDPNNFTNAALPMEPYSWNFQQPVVNAVPKARYWGEVLLDVAGRLGVLPDMYSGINAGLLLKGEYQLKRDGTYTWEEISDRRTKSYCGEEHGLDYFYEHGYYQGEERLAKHGYPLIHHGARIPLYLEHFIDAGEAVRAYADAKGFAWDTSDYLPLTEWKPCLTAEQAPAQFDLFVINQKLTFMAGSYSGENPLLLDLATRNTKVFTVGINAATGRAKGIHDGDEIELETVAGKRARGIARLSEAIHPECVTAPGMFGRRAAGNPALIGKGIHFNGLLTYNLDHMDGVSAALDNCVKVRISRVH